MIDLSDDEWSLLSLGGFSQLKEKISKDRSDTIEFLDRCTSHVNDIEQFKSLYHYQSKKIREFPPEYSNGFSIDNRLETILSFMKKYNTRNVLDVGSRAGFLLFSARKRNVIDSAVGIDIDTTFVDLTNRAVAAYGFTGLEFKNELFEDFQSDRIFDAVIMTDILEHVIDPGKFLKKSYLFVKNSGIIIISVPVGRPPIMQREKDSILSSIQQEHIHLIDLDTMKQLCKDSGYTFIESTSLVSFFNTDISVFKKD